MSVVELTVILEKVKAKYPDIYRHIVGLLKTLRDL